MTARFVLADVIAERKAKHPPIEIDLGEGDPILVPPIEMWDDDAVALADRDRVAAVRQVLGEQYERFRAACAALGDGSAAVLSEIVLERAQAGSLGESSPSASS